MKPQFSKNRAFLFLTLLAVAVVTALLLIFNAIKPDGVPGSTNTPARWFAGAETDAARYSPGQPVKLTVQLLNPTGERRQGQIEIRWRHLDEQIGEKMTVPVDLQPHEQRPYTITWTPPAIDYRGYMAEADLLLDGRTADGITTAVDVSSDWSRFPRYGYLSEFPDMKTEDLQRVIDRLNRYHLNGLQFYDWQWKHNEPLPTAGDVPLSRWNNVANQEVRLDTVKRYIEFAHDKNMMAMNYNLLYGSYANQESSGVKPEWGLYQDAEHTRQDVHPLPESWASSIQLMNPANPDWQRHLFEQEKKVFANLDFDGLHVDQLGDRGSRWDAGGNPVDLAQSFGGFLAEARKQLGKRLVMNAVSGYGQQQIADSGAADFLYTEVWENQPTYADLKQILDSGSEWTQGSKNMVLAGYMNYRLADRPGQFNKAGILMTDSVIFALGGSHIELGDSGMLSKEYFPNKSLRMSSDLEQDLQSYYDFIVAYENLLRDNVKDSGLKVESASHPLSGAPAPKAIWYFAKKKENKQILHLINLTNRDDILWRDDNGTTPYPEKQSGVKLSVQVDKPVKKVYMASPDQYHGRSQPLDFKEQDGRLEVTVPSLYYWDMLVIET